MYPSFPNNYPNQYYDQPGYSEQYPSQQPPYQDYYNQPYPSNPGQYYPDQYSATNPAQSGYYPQQTSQNYNNQSYWSSSTYNQDGQTNYNSQQQNNYSQTQQNAQQTTSTSSSSSSSTYYPNSTNNYPNLLKSNSEQSFPLPPRIPTEGTNYNNDYQQPGFPFTSAQQNSTTDTSYSGFNPTPSTPAQENKVNEVKTESTAATLIPETTPALIPEAITTPKEEVKDVLLGEQKSNGDDTKPIESEIKNEEVVEKKENVEESKAEVIDEVLDEKGRKPPPASAIEGDIPPEGIRVPVRLEGKSMLEIGTNAYRASRDEPSIPYDWVSTNTNFCHTYYISKCFVIITGIIVLSIREFKLILFHVCFTGNRAPERL